MPLVNVYGQRRYEEVMADTWGHLAAVPLTKYHGFILFSVSPNGDHNLLDFDFEGLDGNPWTLEHVSEWWAAETEKTPYRSGEVVTFWRWSGTYHVFKNGNPCFRGSVQAMHLAPIKAGA